MWALLHPAGRSGAVATSVGYGANVIPASPAGQPVEVG
jgi:hypothetical protein